MDRANVLIRTPATDEQVAAARAAVASGWLPHGLAENLIKQATRAAKYKARLNTAGRSVKCDDASHPDCGNIAERGTTRPLCPAHTLAVLTEISRPVPPRKQEQQK